MSEHSITRLDEIPERFSCVSREDMTFTITWSEYRWFETEKKNILGRRRRLDGSPSEHDADELKEAAALCRNAGLDFRTWENDIFVGSYYSVLHNENVREHSHVSGMTVEIRKDTPDAALHDLFDYSVRKRTEACRTAGGEWYGRFMDSPAISSISDEVHAAAMRELTFAHENGRSSTMVRAEFREDGVTVRGSLVEPKALDFASMGYRNMDGARKGALVAVVTDRLRRLLLKDPRVFDVYVKQSVGSLDGEPYLTDEFRFGIVLARTKPKEQDRLKDW